ncbi:MAG TPA: hypothetical protein QF753_19735 [Victivallales bacterium]|nr:hypothetical protein [Victivallales bacterium]
MSYKIQNNNPDKDHWEAEFDIAGTGDMAFSYNNRTLLKSRGTELGMLKELNGISEYTRTHTSEKTDWQWVDSKTIHPFGSEPVIKRKWEQASNHIKVVTDITLHSETPMKYMKIDTLEVPGKWSKILIIGQNSIDDLNISVKELDVASLEKNEYKFDCIPLVVLFKAEDGTMLEVGTGYDLWRWSHADRYEAECNYSLIFKSDGILFNRQPFVWNNDHAFPRINLRFTWYFAWGCESENSTADVAKNILEIRNKKMTVNKITDTNSYKIDNSLWPKTAIAENNNSSIVTPCFSSRQTGNLLKKWLRSLFPKVESTGENIILNNIDPGLCLNSSHMERGNNKNTLHCDYLYIMSLWEWANKYLGEFESNFLISIREDSLFKNLPSAKGLEFYKS